MLWYSIESIVSLIVSILILLLVVRVNSDRNKVINDNMTKNSFLHLDSESFLNFDISIYNVEQFLFPFIILFIYLSNK